MYSHPWVKSHSTLAFHLTLTHPLYQNLKFSRILAIFIKICLRIFRNCAQIGCLLVLTVNNNHV